MAQYNRGNLRIGSAMARNTRPAPSPASTPALWLLPAVALFATAWEISLAGIGATPAALLTAAGRFTGLAGLGLWVASLLLTLRPTALERAWGGLDRLYLLHHGLGVLAYVLLLAHPLLLAAAGGRGTPATLALLLPKDPPLVAGWIALLLLMAVLASTFWLPLPYALWRRLHALTAPAFLLGTLHGLALAPAPAWAHRGLVGLALAVGLAALAWRYLLYAGQVGTHDYRVAGVRHPAPGLTELILRPAGEALHWRPGQFVFAAFADGRRFRGCGEFHPYTIASAERSDGRLTLLVKSLGDCTRNIQGVEPGVPVRLQGPFGAFLQARDEARRQLWIAGGIGITPFLAAAETLGVAAQGVDLAYIHRDSPPAGQARLEALARRHRALHLHNLAGEPTPEALGDWLRSRIPDLARRQVFLCGPPGLVDGLGVRLLQAGVAAEDIHSERFDLR
jgi:predicted ferric reductase